MHVIPNNYTSGELNMRYLLSFLLLFGITLGQKIVTVSETEGEEKKVEVRKEITENKMTVKITKDGETKEYSADLDDDEAVAEIEEKLEELDFDGDVKISKRVMKRECDKKVKVHRDCDHDFVWRTDGDDEELRKTIKLIEPFADMKPSGYLGVHIQNLSEQLSEYFKIKDGKGVLVTEVEEDSPAENAGLRAGDIITKINDEEITSTAELSKTVRSYAPDTNVAVSVLRDGKKKKLNATLAESEMNMWFAHHDFEMPDMEKFNFHDFKIDEEKLKVQLKGLEKELEKLKKEFQEFRDEK